MTLHRPRRPRSRQSRICSEVGSWESRKRLLADRIFGAARSCKVDRRYFRCMRLRLSQPGIPVLLKALYFKGIASIRKMLATQKYLCCLIQRTRILSRNSGINNWLTSVGRGSSGALTTPLSINFFAVLSQKFALESSLFLSCGGVSKYS